MTTIDSEFNELEFSKDIEDMSEETLRETLTQFMKDHRQNVEAFSEAVEALTEREEKLGEFKDGLAEEASQYANIPAGIMVDRFTFSELEQIIEEGEDAEFSEDKDEEDETLTTFSDREEKGRMDSESNKKFREQAKTALSNKGFPVE